MTRNQFIVGSRFAARDNEWRQMEVADGLIVSAHQSLALTKVVRGERTISVIGYCLDPYHPGDDDQSVAARVLESWQSGDGLHESTSMLGGRFVILACKPGSWTAFSDPGGLRQLFYTTSAIDGSVWCASQPLLFQGELQVEGDPEAEEFFQSQTFQNMRGGAWWPGYSSPWKGVRRLLPNQEIDLRSGVVQRFWPKAPIPDCTMDSAVRRGSQLLTGLVESAARRFPMELMITAGWDSRLLLAACRKVKNDITYMSLVTPDGSESDSTVPAELLGKLGLEHAVERAKDEPSDEFWAGYSAEAFLPQRSYASNAEIVRRRMAREKVAITGHMGEIVKGFYRLSPLEARELPPATIARLTGLSGSAFAEREYGRWKQTVGELFNIPLLDLFYWEQRVGSWAPSWMLDYDYCWRDCFIPFNCRELLVTFLGVPERERRGPVIELYRRLILELWPEVLSVPVGGRVVPARPAWFWERAKRDLRTMLRDLRANAKYMRSGLVESARPKP